MTETPMGSRDDMHMGGTGGTTSSPVAFPIAAESLGEVTISPTGAFEAGSYQTFNLVYTAGKFGIDDSGSMRVCFRFASDQTRPQFEDPTGPNYTTITASNNAVLTYHYDPKGNVGRGIALFISKLFADFCAKVTASPSLLVTALVGRRVCGCRHFARKRMNFIR